MRCRIYTDGSYDNENNIGGWSNIIVNKDKVKVKSGIKFDTTNNQVELIAVLNALEYAETHYTESIRQLNAQCQFNTLTIDNMDYDLRTEIEDIFDN